MEFCLNMLLRKSGPISSNKAEQLTPNLRNKFQHAALSLDQKAQVSEIAQKLLESTFQILKYLQLIERVWSNSILPVIEGNGHSMSRHPAKGWISSRANLTGKEKFYRHGSLISFHYGKWHSVGTDSWIKTSEHTCKQAGPFFSWGHAF